MQIEGNRKARISDASMEPSVSKQSEETLPQLNRQILTLYRLSEIFQSPKPLSVLYNDIVEEICSATGFPIATIAVMDRSGEHIVFLGSRGIPFTDTQTALQAELDDAFSGVIIKTGKPLVISHATSHPEYRSTILQQLGAETFVGYPMTVNGKIIGAIGLAHPENIQIDDQTKQWMESLSNYVAALTEMKRSESELRASQEQLRDLTAHLQSAIEDQRKSIAREIHDELGQQLSLLQLELGLVDSKLRSDQKELRKQFKSMSNLIDSAVHTVQRISSDLRPTLLDNLGIGAAVEWQVKEFQKRTTIACDVVVAPPDLKLDQDRSTALFRILQEALTNVARHARATKVVVRFNVHNQEIQLSIKDNGIGIPKDRVSDSKSFGLIGMRERIYQFGGAVTVVGVPGNGTQVNVTIPGQS